MSMHVANVLRLGRTISLIYLLVTCSCVPREAETTTVSSASVETSEPRDEANEVIQQLMPEFIRETERIRELSLRETFETVILTQEEIATLISSELDEIDWEAAQIIMDAFGFLPERVSAQAVITELLSSEVVGLYDHRRDQMIVLETVAESFNTNSEQAAMSRMVFVHEITHALQDQHFESMARTDDEAWSDDADSVYNYLVEGGATLTMLIALMRRSGAPFDPTLHPGFPARIRQAGESAIPQSEAMSEAPPYLSFTMTASYLEGAGFVADIRRLGGWEAVNEAHRNPPRSTRDILHTERYLTGHRIFTITLPEDFTGLTEGGCERVATETLGELETAAFLLPLADVTRARSAAAGWAGDQFAVYRREDGNVTLLWRLRFENADEASEFYTAARDSVIATSRGPCEEVASVARPNLGEGSAVRCHEGRDWLERREADIAVIRNSVPESIENQALLLLAAPVVAQEIQPPQPALLTRWQQEQSQIPSNPVQ